MSRHKKIVSDSDAIDHLDILVEVKQTLDAMSATERTTHPLAALLETQSPLAYALQDDAQRAHYAKALGLPEPVKPDTKPRSKKTSKPRV